MKETKSKKELEELIAEVKTIGVHTFDEEQKCFFTDVKTYYCLREVDKDKYICESWEFDGYEIWMEAWAEMVGMDEAEVEETFTFEGTQTDVTANVINAFKSDPEGFIGYPIFYTNIAVVFEMKNGKDIIYRPNGEVVTEERE